MLSSHHHPFFDVRDITSGSSRIQLHPSLFLKNILYLALLQNVYNRQSIPESILALQQKRAETMFSQKRIIPHNLLHGYMHSSPRHSVSLKKKSRLLPKSHGNIASTKNIHRKNRFLFSTSTPHLIKYKYNLPIGSLSLAQAISSIHSPLYKANQLYIVY